MQSLKKRPDFLRVSAKGRKAVAAHFILLACEQPEGAPAGGEARCGFTVTRKLGNAVARNRIRRRLREAVRRETESMRPGFDYVLIARNSALLCPFAELIRDLRSALAQVHAGGRQPETKPATKPAKKAQRS